MARINGAELYHEISGEGYPLVLLHDGLLDSRVWDEQFEIFSESYETIRYDRRGYGRSRSPSSEFSHVEDLRALLGFLGVGRTHLLGASNGGRIAVDFALQYPGMVRSMILVAPNLSGYRISSEMQRSVSAIFSVAREEGISRWQEMWLDDPFWAPDKKHTAVRRKIETLLVTAFHNFFDNPLRPARQEPPAVGRLSEIKVPTLIVIGERDAPDNHAIADTLEVGISEAEKMVMPATGHMLNLEKPEEFNRLVLRFLERLGTEGRGKSDDRH